MPEKEHRPTPHEPRSDIQQAMPRRRNSTSLTARHLTDTGHLLWAWGIAAFGLILLFASQYPGNHWMWKITRAVLNDLGGLIIASVALGLVWDKYGKRTFRDELFAQYDIGADIRDAGIEGFVEAFQDITEWDELFERSQHIDIFVGYASSWRGSRRRDFQSFLGKDNTHLRVILPDFTDGKVVAQLAHRFGYTDEDLKKRIQDAVQFYQDLRTALAPTSTIEIWLSPMAPQFSCYRFDNQVVVAYYSHLGPEAVPAIFAGANGSLFRFVQREIDGIIKVSKKVPAPEQPQAPAQTLTQRH